MTNIISCSQFPQFLVSQEPVYDRLILADIRPTDGWITHVDTGTFEAYSGVQHTLDRFNHVFPNTTKIWRPTQAGNCLGTPCDKVENSIGWGASRLTYFLEEQSWNTPLLCYDQDMHITHAKEHFRQIIGDILKPATSAIMSNFLRKRVAQFADTKMLANATMSAFTYTWIVVGDEEVYIDVVATNGGSAVPTSKLTPQMLQRQVAPLMLNGYFGKQPFKDMPPMIELVSDMETVWELDHLANNTTPAGGNFPTVAGNWRFQQWDEANKYWRYGFSGAIGNFATRVDPMGLRFNYVGASPLGGGAQRFQVVLPYKNIPSSGAGGAAGIKSVVNIDYQNAQYGFTYIYHRKGIQALVADATPVNPEMPFSSRNFGGKWQFVMDNLGVGADGCVIENKRRNKGQFIGDFKLAIRPQYTEFLEVIFHKREPACIVTIAPCNNDPGYPVQAYGSVNTSCAPDTGTAVVTFTPTKNLANGDYEVAANSTTCEGGPIASAGISGATTLAALVVQLNSVLGSAGRWAVLNSTQITLTGTCNTFGLPFVA